MAKPVYVTDADFDEVVINSSKPVLVDFWAAWCGPCKMIEPIIEEMAADFDGQAVIAKMDVDQNPNTAVRFGIRSIPTLLVFKDGKIVDKQIGATAKAELVKKLTPQLG